MTSVAVLGGGVGGLSAAHELATRGFEVSVYEARDVFGGKARSIPVPNTGVGGRLPLPGEHGFRFFPGFYRHLNATMEAIPLSEGRTVKDNLVQTSEMLLAQADGRNEIAAPTVFPTTFGDLERIAKFVHAISVQVGVPLAEYVLFFNRLLDYLTSCDERRLAEFEGQSWWDFVEADGRSPAYQNFLATGMTRTLVAARAEEMSARTGCAVLCQLMQDMARTDGQVDRVLNGPTSEVWIDPWVAYLHATCGVEFVGDHEVTRIDSAGTEITSVTVRGAGGLREINADYYIAAMPVERLVTLVTADLAAAEPRLNQLQLLTTRSMTGAMYYLAQDRRVVNGHIIFLDSAWALTAISQQQFWNTNLRERGDGTAKGILSVDISDWTTRGLNGLTATECTEEQILDEVWAQIVAHIDDGTLDRRNVVHRFLDPAIQFDPETKTVVKNQEPLLINTANSWVNRPDANTRIRNLVLAADFVRTNTDLATMEGANEAARRAANAILDAENSSQERCKVFDLDEPALLAPFRVADGLLWKLGRRGRKRSPIHVGEDGHLVAADLDAG